MVVLFQPPRVEPDPDQVFTNGQPLENFHNFAYLDSSLYDEAKLDVELEKHIARAPSTFGWLRKRLWNTDHVTMSVNRQVYRAVVLTLLVCGPGTSKLGSCMPYRQDTIMGHITNTGTLKEQTSQAWNSFCCKSRDFQIEFFILNCQNILETEVAPNLDSKI